MVNERYAAETRAYLFENQTNTRGMAMEVCED
jgi:hypothetical protein